MSEIEEELGTVQGVQVVKHFYHILWRLWLDFDGKKRSGFFGLGSCSQINNKKCMCKLQEQKIWMINYRSEQRHGLLPSSTTTLKEVSAKPGKQFKKEIRITK